MGYAEGNTHGFTPEDMAKEPVYFRILDCGEFENSNDLIDSIRTNWYKTLVIHITPFIDFEVELSEYEEVKAFLDNHLVYYRVF